MTTKEVRTRVKAGLEADTLIQAQAIPVVIDNGETGEDSEQEQALKDKRMVLVISPVVTSEGRSQAAARIVESITWAVSVRRSKKCTVDHDDACDAVIRALLGLIKADTLPGLALGADGTIRQLAKNDAGLLTTQILFTVPLTLQAT